MNERYDAYRRVYPALRFITAAQDPESRQDWKLKTRI